MTGFKYVAPQNHQRVGRGLVAIGLHPDDEDIETSAGDIVADICHALHARDIEFDPAAFFARVESAYHGDFEDE